MQNIPAVFFLRKPEIVARELIGCIFSHTNSNGVRCSVRLTETEAYLSADDDACHAARGQTKRNAPMFLEGGILYVYFIYGMHWCANIVTQEEGVGSAVLLRGSVEVSGPGRLAKHLSLDGSFNKVPVTGGVIQVSADEHTESYRNRIVVTKRIGITKSADLPLRFVVGDSGRKVGS